MKWLLQGSQQQLPIPASSSASNLNSASVPVVAIVPHLQNALQLAVMQHVCILLPRVIVPYLGYVVCAVSCSPVRCLPIALYSCAIEVLSLYTLWIWPICWTWVIIFHACIVILLSMTAWLSVHHLTGIVFLPFLLITGCSYAHHELHKSEWIKL